jgi:hypothetical protein
MSGRFQTPVILLYGKKLIKSINMLLRFAYASLVDKDRERNYNKCIAKRKDLCL